MKSQIESELVRFLMPDATEDEIAQATRHWFGFLQTLGRIVDRDEVQPRESSESAPDDRVKT